jgi:hypothetical protein
MAPMKLRHAMRKAGVALRGVVASLGRAPRRKKLVADRMAKLVPVVRSLCDRDSVDCITPFPSIRAQAVLRSGIFRPRRDTRLKGA